MQDYGFKKPTAPLTLSFSGLATIINYNFVLEGSPSPSDSVINGIVLSGMTAPYTGGMTIKVRARCLAARDYGGGLWWNLRL